MKNNLSLNIGFFIFNFFNNKDLLKKHIPPLNFNKSLNKEQFSYWLAGFIDGEGNFQVFIDRTYLRLMFRIRLHVEDIDVLYKIKNFICVGKVLIDKNSALFIISDIKSLKNVLIPFLDNYSLCTTKILDYADFKTILEFLYNRNTTRLSFSELNWVNGIISNMNLKRNISNFSKEKIEINRYWLLGFVEAEGTFGYKNLSPYFQIGQHKKIQSLWNL